MNTPTDQQLKQALAKMLPERTAALDEYGTLKWLSTPNGIYLTDQVLDTELLHLCWLVEETLTKRQCQDYTQGWFHVETPNIPPYDYVWHATWQQRTIALCKVKEVEIV